MVERLDCPKCKAPLEGHEVTDGVIVYTCPSCFGVMYDKEVLAVPLNLSAAAPSNWKCPRCQGVLESGSAYDRSLVVDRCASCSAVWFDAGEIQILRRLSGVENLAGRRGEADVDPGPGTQTPASKPVSKSPKSAPAPSEDVPKNLIPPEMANAKNPDEDRAPTVTFDGRVYQHFQTSVPITTSVLGEFPWTATVGDTARMRDFICPPHLLSEEVTATESVWSDGEYVEPEEIWAAFAMTGAPPAKIGVAPAQPNPWAGQLGSLWSQFALASAFCVGVYFMFSVGASRKTVYEGGFSVASTDVERSRVSETFEIPGRTSNLEILLDTNLDGHWAYVSMALIDADTDLAYDFGREVSYYHGYEDGESWSEGSGQERFYLPSVPKGRYYLRLEPETDSPALNVRVVMRRDVPLFRLPFIALILLLVPVLWAGMRSGSFENVRWMESDHPRVSTDYEDDE